ncbi:MAG: hypothetical protein J0H68_01180 [Sphingobacteriia bacterium]|nr:hypothetical protein [Sphingobacteriia bacterium]
MLKTENQPKKEQLPLLIFPENHNYLNLAIYQIENLKHFKDLGYDTICFEFEEAPKNINLNIDDTFNLLKNTPPSKLANLPNFDINNPEDLKKLRKQYETQSHLLKYILITKAKDLSFKIEFIDTAVWDTGDTKQLTRNFQFEYKLFHETDDLRKSLYDPNGHLMAVSHLVNKERERKMAENLQKLQNEKRNILFFGLGTGHLASLSEELEELNISHFNILFEDIKNEKTMEVFGSKPLAHNLYKHKGFVTAEILLPRPIKVTYVSLSLEENISYNTLNSFITTLIKNNKITLAMKILEISFYRAFEQNKELQAFMQSVNFDSDLLGLENPIVRVEKPKENISQKSTMELFKEYMESMESALKNEQDEQKEETSVDLPMNINEADNRQGDWRKKFEATEEKLRQLQI